jgi:primosomal protein N' (replication factor Y)
MPATKTYLVEVAPVSKAARGSLSYFSAVKIAPGAFVKVPLRKGTATGVVLSAKEVRQEKFSLRQATFALRKIRQSDILEAMLPAAALGAAAGTARFYAAPLGAALAVMLPKAALEEPRRFFPLAEKGVRGKRRRDRERAEKIVLQMESVERFGQYRTLVRQAFAQSRSVLLLVPTRLDAERVAKHLSTGIAEFVHVYTAEGKGAAETWGKALHEKHPILLITTPTGLLFPRADVGMIIIERENSRAYRTLVRPFLDAKFTAEALAKEAGSQCVRGDSVLSVESLWHERRGYAAGLAEEDSLIRWRLPGAPSRLIDSRTKTSEGGRFEIFSPELKAFMTETLAGGESIFLFGVRKGLAPSTVCGDCGSVLPCGNCGAPVVLHEKGRESIYICHACGATRETLTLCPVCRSWRLVPLGIGTEEIARLAHALFPKTPVRLLDKNHAPSEAKARAIVREFAEEGGILVGTELAFYHLESVAHAAVVSLDSLFSLPDFHAHERIFYLVSRLRELTRGTALIQTKNIGKQLLSWAAHGNILDFYQNEIKEREELLYPPFSIFVKIEAADRAALDLVRERLALWRPDIIRHALVIRLSRELWPETKLLQELSLLGPEFSIKVDPESLL